MVAALGVAAVVVLGTGIAAGQPDLAPSPPGVLAPDPVILDVPAKQRPLDVVAGDPVRPTVVLALHGYTADPEVLRNQLDTDAFAAELDATVVMPTGLGARPSWNAGSCCGSASRSNVADVAFLAGTIQRLRARGAEQVFVVGYSNGGMMAYRLACERPSLVDGVVVVNGTVTVADCPGAFEALHLAGADDRAVPVQGAGLVPYLFTGFPPLVDVPDLAPRADVEVRVLPDVGHEIAPQVHAMVRDWIAARQV